MSEFKVKVCYLRKKKRRFFNDKETRDYHELLVINSEVMPDEFFIKDRIKNPCQIWILDDLVKELGIESGNLSREVEDYKFVISFEKNKSAKFNTNNKNWMVLKTKNYFEDTIKKIGFWGNNDYFYEMIKKPNSIRLESKTDWGKITLFCLPIILFTFFVFLIVKLVSKKLK